MDIDSIVEQTFITLVKQNGLDGELEKEELVALLGMSHRAVQAELEIAASFLERSPAQEEVVRIYKSERGKDAAAVMASVDTRSASVDIGTLRGVKFTPQMWEVVKGCRVAGHFAKLDMLANYYASKWGDPGDGTFSIDVQANSSTQQAAKSGCMLIVGVVLGGAMAGASALLW